VAILLEDAVRDEIAAAIERLQPASRDVAWVNAGSIHLTVKFLGNVTRERIDPIVAALAGAVGGVGVFDATIRGLGAFPSLARPRVIWAGVTEGAGAMVEAARRVDEALATVGVPREARPFSPHATLGRVRRPGANPTLASALRAEEVCEFGRIHVSGIRLMRSELSPRGAQYTELATVALAKGGV
jgi:2'-5' RNA ligase